MKHNLLYLLGSLTVLVVLFIYTPFIPDSSPPPPLQSVAVYSSVQTWTQFNNLQQFSNLHPFHHHTTPPHRPRQQTPSTWPHQPRSFACGCQWPQYKLLCLDPARHRNLVNIFTLCNSQQSVEGVGVP